MDRRNYQNSMGNFEQLLDQGAPITFFKYDWLFEKLDEITKLDFLYHSCKIFLIHGQRYTNARLLYQFEQPTLSGKEMRLIFT